MKYKIKKLLQANFKSKNDYEKLLFNMIHQTEVFSIILVLLLMAIDLFFGFKSKEYLLVLIATFVTLFLTTKLSFKFVRVKVFIFSVFLYLGGVYFLLYGYKFALWFLLLFIYLSFITNKNVALVALGVVIATIYFLGENSIPILDISNFNNQWNFLLIFIILSVATIYLVNNVSIAFKRKFEENESNINKILSDNKKFTALNKQLLREADIREQIQSDLESSRQRFKTIFDEASDVIIILDYDENILEVNKAALDRYGLSDSQMRKMKYSDLVSDDIKPLLKERKDYVVEHKFAVFESEFIKDDGEKVYLENKVSYIENFNYKFLINISRDISDRVRKEKEAEEKEQLLRKMVLERTAQLEDALTELKSEIDNKTRTENELIKAKQSLEKSLENEIEYNNLRARFISMISHEYRTPLTVILSSTYILEHYFKKQDIGNFNKNISKIQSSVQSMTNLLEDVIKIGKAEKQYLQVELNKFEVMECLRDVVAEMKLVDKVSHIYKIESKITQLVINFDERLFTTILSEIIKNAAKFSEKDSIIELNLRLEESDMIVEIADQGIGIPEKDLKYMFDPFFRSSNVGAREGTGLGLLLTKRYVESLNGKIDVESNENIGTKVKLTFPLSNFDVKY